MDKNKKKRKVEYGKSGSVSSKTVTRRSGKKVTRTKDSKTGKKQKIVQSSERASLSGDNWDKLKIKGPEGSERDVIKDGKRKTVKKDRYAGTKSKVVSKKDGSTKYVYKKKGEKKLRGKEAKEAIEESKTPVSPQDIKLSAATTSMNAKMVAKSVLAKLKKKKYKPKDVYSSTYKTSQPAGFKQATSSAHFKKNKKK